MQEPTMESAREAVCRLMEQMPGADRVMVWGALVGCGWPSDLVGRAVDAEMPAVER